MVTTREPPSVRSSYQHGPANPAIPALVIGAKIDASGPHLVIPAKAGIQKGRGRARPPYNRQKPGTPPFSSSYAALGGPWRRACAGAVLPTVNKHVKILDCPPYYFASRVETVA